MLDFPGELKNRTKIDKERFYAKQQDASTLKRKFTDQIDAIHWRHRLTPSTLHVLSDGAGVEIEVIEVQLKERTFDVSLLTQIDLNLPYYILFHVIFQNEAQAWIGFKDINLAIEFKPQPIQYYHTPWMPLEQMKLRIRGVSVTDVYYHFIRQIQRQTPGAEQWSETLSVAENMAQDAEQNNIRKQIQKLERKIKNEKQFNRQVKLQEELRSLQAWRRKSE